MLHFLNNWKNSVAIGQWGCVWWQLKKIGRYLTHRHHQMAIEIFQLRKSENTSCFSKMIAHFHTPFGDWKILVVIRWSGVSDGDWKNSIAIQKSPTIRWWGVLDGDRKNSIAIWKSSTIQWWLKLFYCQERGASHIFLKALNFGQPKIFQSLQIFYCCRVGDWKNFIAVRFGNQKVLVATMFGDRIRHTL